MAKRIAGASRGRLLRLIRHIDAFNAAIGRAVAWLCLPIIAVIVLDVVSRHFFATGSVALQELEWHFHGVLFLLAIALVMAEMSAENPDFAKVYKSQKDFRARLDEWMKLSSAVR